MNPLLESWKKFALVALDPISVLLIVTGGGLTILSVSQANALISSVLTLIISILAGIVGALWYDKWTARNAERMLLARGKVAVRSLKLLLGQVISLDDRVQVYARRLRSENLSASVTEAVIMTYFEEVIGRCGLLQDDTVGSIENWIDIVPEADVKTDIGAIRRLKEDAVQQTLEVERLRSALQESEGRSQLEQRELEARLREKESALSKLHKELDDKRLFSGITVAGTASPFELVPIGELLLHSNSIIAEALDRQLGADKCGNCGADLPPSILVQPDRRCAKCGHLVS